MTLSAEPIPDLPFECIVLHGTEAEARLRELTRPGVVPVLLGDREGLVAAAESISLTEESFEELVAHGLELNVEEWIEQRFRGDPEYYVMDETRTGTAAPIESLMAACDFVTGRPLKEVHIGLIPVESPYLVPAYLKAGGWNDCPPSSVHTALFRRWFERYGAIVRSVSNDIIEFEVARPPESYEAALQLAREQFAYCPDIVHQGVGTIGDLADSLNGSRYWYFWWD